MQTFVFSFKMQASFHIGTSFGSRKVLFKTRQKTKGGKSVKLSAMYETPSALWGQDTVLGENGLHACIYKTKYAAGGCTRQT